jgi:16S rRNA (cytidine1402-2'-O)-methyltransferase
VNDAKLIFGTMPIGDSDDSTYNLIQHIKDVDVVAVENEEKIKELIDYYKVSTDAKIVSISPKNFMDSGLVNDKSGLNNSLKSVHDNIFMSLDLNQSVLCLSDEGSAIVTDPFIYVRQLAIAKGIKYKVLPGPSAVIAAVSYSKLYAGSSFSFYGMLYFDPNKEYIYESIKNSRYTSVVFYHHEIQDAFLNELLSHVGSERKITLVSNVTSKDEIVKDGTLSDIIDFVSKNDVRQPTLVISGKS